LAYRAGLVRKVGEREVALRAPLLRQVIYHAEQRVEKTRAVMLSNFALDGVREPEKQKARCVVKDIEGAAFDGTLTSLHVGSGRRIQPDCIDLKTVALGRGQYSAKIKLDVARDIKIGDELWFVHWGSDPEPGRRQTELHTFAVKEVPADAALDEDAEDDDGQ
jgi:hypothetical protein